MPQSWPSQWTILFILFLCAFFLILISTFFISKKKGPSSTLSSLQLNSLNWQW